MRIRDRVRELRRVRAGDLVPHPKNWRTHPKAQRDALLGVLSEIGYADALLARELPGGGYQLIDGHLRAETTPDQDVPVLVVDLDDAEADKLLTLLDPLSGMAEADAAQLDVLLASIETESAAVGNLLDELRELAHPGGVGETRIGLTGGTPGVVVKALLAVDGVRDVERALAATGRMGRGEAFVEICREYLRGKGQLDVPAQGVPAAADAAEGDKPKRPRKPRG